MIWNGFYDEVGGKPVITPRGSVKPASVTTFSKSVAPTGDTPRGIFWANDIARLIEVWSDDIYVDGTKGTGTMVDTASAGPCGFAEGRDTDGTAYCFVASRTKSVYVNSAGTVTAITDSDYPANVVPTPVVLDSYVFIPQESTNKIYNSSPGDKTVWQASTYMVMEQEGDNVVGLAKHHNMLVAFGTRHTEFFRDAGIASPNSPLLRVTEYTRKIGCVNRASIVTFDDVTFFIGIDESGIIGVYKLEDFRIEKISTPTIDQQLRNAAGSNKKIGVLTTDWVDYATATPGSGSTTAMVLESFGRPLYIINRGGASSLGATSQYDPALVYDTKFKLWYMWSGRHYYTAGGAYVWGAWSFPFMTSVKSSALSQTYQYGQPTLGSQATKPWEYGTSYQDTTVENTALATALEWAIYLPAIKEDGRYAISRVVVDSYTGGGTIYTFSGSTCPMFYPISTSTYDTANTVSPSSGNPAIFNRVTGWNDISQLIYHQTASADPSQSRMWGIHVLVNASKVRQG